MTMIHIALVRTDPSPFGPHYWASWLKCERMAWLSELERAHREPGELTGILHFDTGSIVHALLALYYSLAPQERLKVDTTRVKYVTSAGPLDTERYAEAIYEAERLFRAYRVFWGANDLGKVVAVERELQAHLPNEPKWLEYHLTGALDLAVKLTKKDLSRANLEGVPGLYIVDHKTRSRKDPYEYEMACHDLQFSTYPKLAESAGPKWGPVRGFIVNLLYKGTTPTFERFVVPKMALDAEWPVSQGLYHLAFEAKRTALQVIDVGGLPAARTTACFKKSVVGWDICQFYKSSQCNRKQKT